MASGAFDGTSGQCHIVAVPYPGRGHINPMMCLARLLVSRGLLVTFVVTDEWLSLLLSTVESSPPNLRFRTIPNVIPSEIGRGADFSGFLEAVFTKMEQPFEQLLDQLEPKKVSAIVADTFLPWAVAVGERRGVPVCSLWTESAAFFSIFYHFDLIFGSGNDLIDIEECLERHLPDITPINLGDLNSLLSMDRPLKRALEAFSWVRKVQCVLFTSFNELEATMSNTLREELPYPVYPVGPLIPHMILKENPSKTVEHNGSIDYIKWLDSQPKNSVLYVSLGSFLSLSGPQMEEIAMGLHDSGIPFLWVARGDCSHIQEMTDGTGFMVPWCDQLRVLCHSSVGGFLTHCGWNSTLEGVFAGLPILTLPIFWDQPPNSRLIVDKWKIGLNVREEAQKGNFFGREDIAKVAKRLMDLDGMESRDRRQRAMELRESALAAIEEGGSSCLSIEAFVEDLRSEQLIL